MVTKYLIFCVLLLKFNFVPAQIVELDIISVPLFISTPYRISCNQFEKSFQEKKELKVKSLCTIKQIRKLFSKFKSAQEITGIDVRGKLVVNYANGQIQQICFDQFGHFLMKGAFYENKDLFAFLLKEKIIEENVVPH